MLNLLSKIYKLNKNNYYKKVNGKIKSGNGKVSYKGKACYEL